MCKLLAISTSHVLYAQVVKPQIFRVPLAPIVCSCTIFGGVCLYADPNFQHVSEVFRKPPENSNALIMPLHSLQLHAICPFLHLLQQYVKGTSPLHYCETLPFLHLKQSIS